MTSIRNRDGSFMLEDQIVDHLRAQLMDDPDALAKFRSVPRDDLCRHYHHGLGTAIRNDYGLWHQTGLSGGCNGDHPMHPDNMSMRIIERVWDAVQVPQLARIYSDGRLVWTAKDGPATPLPPGSVVYYMTGQLGVAEEPAEPNGSWAWLIIWAMILISWGIVAFALSRLAPS